MIQGKGQLPGLNVILVTPAFENETIEIYNGNAFRRQLSFGIQIGVGYIIIE